VLDPEAVPGPAPGVRRAGLPPPPLDGSEASRTSSGEIGPIRLSERLAALIEVVLCSGFPTQLAVMVGLTALGLRPLTPDGDLSLPYVTWLSLADTALLLGLVFLFLGVRGESPHALLLGRRPLKREALLGVLLVPVVVLAVGGMSVLVQRFMPWLHNVPDNPLASLLRDWTSIAAFAVVAVVAGGVREEVQRAFILTRFERYLGSALAGLAIFSLAFGAGHLLQGWDAALLTAMLGAFWGVVYLQRRSVVAPLVCHALFNLAEVIFHGATM
jgi:membrane protease YdiL (CAAX protease family)